MSEQDSEWLPAWSFGTDDRGECAGFKAVSAYLKGSCLRYRSVLTCSEIKSLLPEPPNLDSDLAVEVSSLFYSRSEKAKEHSPEQSFRRKFTDIMQSCFSWQHEAHLLGKLCAVLCYIFMNNRKYHQSAHPICFPGEGRIRVLWCQRAFQPRGLYLKVLCHLGPCLREWRPPILLGELSQEFSLWTLLFLTCSMWQPQCAPEIAFRNEPTWSPENNEAQTGRFLMLCLRWLTGRGGMLSSGWEVDAQRKGR